MGAVNTDDGILMNMIKDNPSKTALIKKKIKKLKLNNFNFNKKYYHGKTLLHYAVENKTNKVIVTLIKNGCNPNICDDNYLSPIHQAVIKNNYKAAKILLKKGADVDISGEFEQTPLHLATIYGNLKMVKLLIKYNADISLVDEKNLSVLDYAKDEKNTEIINYLNNLL